MRKQSNPVLPGMGKSASLLLGLIAFLVVPAVLTAGGTNDFIRGDANADGTINIVDPIVTLAYLTGEEDVLCLDSADTNDDGSVDVVDAVYHFHYLFQASFPPPAAPFPACGVDPTPDALDCVDYAVCP